MTKVITYGTFDLFHQGHYNLLKRAKELGDYLIVGITSDNFDLERGKINTCDDIIKRIESVKETGFADQIVIEEYKGQKIDDIQRYGVDIFAIGSDWKGKFDYLNDYCKVVYLPRTEGVSSTQLRTGRANVKLGIIGTGSIARRFVPEASFVNTLSVVTAYNPDRGECQEFCDAFHLEPSSSLQELLEKVDSVYVASPHYTHYEYVKAALNAGKNVLCETPFVFSEGQAKELYGLAGEKKSVLMVALKTAYCPAFNHLVSLLKSGEIGDIVEVNASTTTLTDETSDKMVSKLNGGSMSENACFTLLPILKLLGTGYQTSNFFSIVKNDVDIYTKGILTYRKAIASFQVGLGAKTEGNMVIAGTKGYAYVPAPWWKTDFFEIRYEDQTRNRKFFYPYEGEGLRYEIKAFSSCILNGTFSISVLTPEENIVMAKIQEEYINHHNNLL